MLKGLKYINSFNCATETYIRLPGFEIILNFLKNKFEFIGFKKIS